MGEPRIDDTGRLEKFADGVMAIAITLLILEVHVPHTGGRSLGTALARQRPSYAGFLVSFLTIGIIWVNHHHMFKLIARSNHAFLMLLADYVRNPDGRTLATVVYGGAMTAIAIMFNVVWRYAATKQRLMVPASAMKPWPR